MPLRVVFAGTPPFAARALEAIAAAGHSIPLVLTQPDRPAGRGLQLAASAVGTRALELGLRVLKPASLKSADILEVLRGARADFAVVAAYGLLLPPAVLEIPSQGCLNIHASLLPRWRGAAPIQRALLAGDMLTGVSIMRMEAGLDTGPVMLTKPHPIGPRDTTGSLTAALAELGALAIVEVLADPAAHRARPQENELATYASKVAKSEARIDWSRPNVEVDRLVRAFDPSPGAEAAFGNETLKIWDAQPVAGSGAPGEVIERDNARLVVACGTGALAIATVQRPGGKRLPVAEFLRGARLELGARLKPTTSAA